MSAPTTSDQLLELACKSGLLDPPHATPGREVGRILDLLTSGWLAPGATVGLTRPRRDHTDVIPLNWQVARRLEYGDTLVVLYQEV